MRAEATARSPFPNADGVDRRVVKLSAFGYGYRAPATRTKHSPNWLDNHPTLI